MPPDDGGSDAVDEEGVKNSWSNRIDLFYWKKYITGITRTLALLIRSTVKAPAPDPSPPAMQPEPGKKLSDAFRKCKDESSKWL